MNHLVAAFLLLCASPALAQDLPAVRVEVGRLLEVGATEVTQEPNRLGLYDLFDNVWEWCDTEDPQGFQADRGGGYRSTARLMNAAARGALGAGSWGDDLGFRVVRTVQE